MRSIPDATTRALALKSGEADIAYALDGVDAEGLQKDPRLKVVATKHASIFWVEMTEQWDPKSPWHDIRVRQAANYALDRAAINEAGCLGFCPPAGVIVPRVMEFALPAEPWPYDPDKAKKLLAEAGYPNGFDAGQFTPNPGFPTVAEATMNYLNAVGIRLTMRQMERAAFYADWQAKKLHGVVMVGAGNSGNAASRVEAFIQSNGPYAYGGYPDIDALYAQQATERDSEKRKALLYQIQKLTIDRAMYVPVMDLRALMGIGPRITKHTITDVWMSPFPSYEDLEIKG
jgi:peptide/nickel transport system substrate-binding protein